ncbi:MAG TPA: efflux RND transporter periplasmic adaptor subunit [Blastocatellia bacterium]|nr:efflux RND transporter periplasmic adaptor subunit [Blastocatellia bacterium]
MDRALDSITRKKLIARRIIIPLLIVALGSAALVWGGAWLKPTVARTRIRTAKVDVGPIEANITATGVVLPEFEQVISSPLDARVVKVLKKPGATLKKGEPILELDVSQANLSLEKINQQIELKLNQQAKAKLDLESTLNSINSQWELKNLDYKSAKAATARNRTLKAEGLLSEERLREVELQEEKTARELKQLETSKRTAEQSTKTQLEGLALEMKTLEKERDEARRLLELATTKADRDGVLTWVVTEEGSTISKGAVIARIADLSTFRVEATVSDVHASRLSAGLPVQVKVNDETLSGALTRINPAVQNGVMTIVVGIDDKSNAQLRSNLRVDVLIATERKERALRIKKGPFASGEGTRDVFVVRGDVAVKTPVQFGIASFEQYEVMQGLYEGDEVIISDMNDYQHLKEVKLK